MQILYLDSKLWKKEIKRFVSKHHQSRSLPSCYQFAYGILKAGKLCAVSIYAQAPTPNIPRAFLKEPETYQKHYIWHSRLIAKGVTRDELDKLIHFANNDLHSRDFYFVHSLNDAKAYLIDSPFRYMSPGFAGKTYIRTGAVYLGLTASKKKITHYSIDGKLVHTRQGKQSLTKTNVRQLFPDAKDIRPIYSGQKQIFCWILSKNHEEFQKRAELIKYPIIPFTNLRQPRLLSILQKFPKRVPLLTLKHFAGKQKKTVGFFPTVTKVWAG